MIASIIAIIISNTIPLWAYIGTVWLASIVLHYSYFRRGMYYTPRCYIKLAAVSAVYGSVIGTVLYRLLLSAPGVFALGATVILYAFLALVLYCVAYTVKMTD